MQRTLIVLLVLFVMSCGGVPLQPDAGSSGTGGSQSDGSGGTSGTGGEVQPSGTGGTAVIADAGTPDDKGAIAAQNDPGAQQTYLFGYADRLCQTAALCNQAKTGQDQQCLFAALMKVATGPLIGIVIEKYNACMLEITVAPTLVNQPGYLQCSTFDVNNPPADCLAAFVNMP